MTLRSTYSGSAALKHAFTDRSTPSQASSCSGECYGPCLGAPERCVAPSAPVGSCPGLSAYAASPALASLSNFRLITALYASAAVCKVTGTMGK